MRQSLLLDWLNNITPFNLSTLEQVSGDASFRRYYRFNVDSRSYIAVDAPPETENTESFVNIAQAYHDAGVRVPNILGVNVNQGFMYLEDFGNTLLGSVLDNSNYPYYYAKALKQLVEIHSVSDIEGELLPSFDNELLNREYGLFTDWLLSTHLGMVLTDQEDAMLKNTFHVLSKNFVEQPQGGVHRDYHSRNIMVLDNEALGIIDFQDAVVGPITYDAVSLLRDCYVRWPEDGIYDVLKAWHNEYFTTYEWDTFKRWFDLTGIQRHIKASGIFARLNHRDNKSLYLEDIPRTLNYIVDVGKQYDELSSFTHFVEQKVLPTLKEIQ